MKNSKICPKCKSQHIANVDNSRGEQFTSIKTGVLTVAKIDCYVCCDCGYIEYWVKKHDDLKKIKEKY